MEITKLQPVLYLVHPFTVIVSYLALKAYQLILTFQIGEDDEVVIIGRVVSLVIPLLLTALTYKKVKIAIWILAGTLLVSGVSGFIAGVAFIPIKKYILKSVVIFLGAYFTYGSLVVLRLKKDTNMETARNVGIGSSLQTDDIFFDFTTNRGVNDEQKEDCYLFHCDYEYCTNYSKCKFGR
jgi:hypothetical protein